MQYPGYVIKRGSSNVEAVNYVQMSVSVTVDGAFGLKTEEAVKNYQTFFGLAADGMVGPKTWDTMVYINSKQESEKAPAPAPVAAPAPKDKGGQIMAMVTVGRNEWDVDEPARAAKRSWDDITGVEVHYTGASGPKSLAFADKKAWCLNIERYHEVTKGWSDIFYNIFVFADGDVWLGRTPLVQSQASLYNWLTVHVPGTVGMTVTDIQKKKIAKMADIVGGNLRGHGERAATGCPGSSALEFIQSYRDGSYAEILAAEAAAKAVAEAARFEAEKAAIAEAQAAEEALKSAAAAVKSAEDAAKEAAVAEAAAKTLLLEKERLAVEAEAAVKETEIPESTSTSCYNAADVTDGQVGSLLRAFINWIVNVVIKK